MRIRGHETFSLRKSWLHKGVKNILIDGRVFTRKDINPCDNLGIGTNMVISLRYWLQSAGVMTEAHNENNQKIHVLTDIGNVINNNDPYYEEQGTNYIIHYLLSCNKDQATAWYWFFNVYKSKTINKEQFKEEFGEYFKVNNEDKAAPDKSLDDEYSCLIRTYYSKLERDDDPEETKVSPLTELKLITSCDDKNKDFRKNIPDKDDIHPLIAYAVISKMLVEIDPATGAEHIRDEVRIDDICTQEYNLGKSFNLDRYSIIYILEKLVNMGLIKMSRTAGLDIVKNIKFTRFEDCVQKYYDIINGRVHA